jgi:uncharacterized protein
MPGEEVIETVVRRLKHEEISSGAIVSVIGAVDEFCISNMPKRDAHEDVLTTYTEPCEMSGTGEIVNGAPHMHCVFGRENDETISGHLHWARVKNWFVHVYIIPL